MKTRITVGTVMLLTLGSALAGGMIYQKKAAKSAEFQPVAESVEIRELTPELIAKWKVTATTADYSPAMLPI